MSWVFGLVLEWHDNSELSPSEKHPQNSLTKRKFKAGSWIAVDQEIEATSSLKDPINPKSITGKDFSDYEELVLMMAAELEWCHDIAYLIYELPCIETWQKGEKFLHRAEDWRMFSAEDNWVLFKKRRLWFSTHACHRRPWGQRGMGWRYARILIYKQAYSSVPKVKDTDWRKKLEQSNGQYCD